MRKRLRIAVPLALGALTVGLLMVSSASAIHPTPQGATPVRVPVVPAMKECPTSSGIVGNHGGTLPTNISCPNPDTVSTTVTLGTSIETFARLGFALIRVCNTTSAPGCSALSGGGGGAPDVRIFGNSSDIVCKAGAPISACPGGAGSDYDPSPAAPFYTTGLTSGTNSNNTPPTPVCNPGPPNPATCAAGADMTGTAAIPGSTSTAGQAIRITDHFNTASSTGDPAGCSGSQTCSGTVIDAPFPVAVVCATTTTGAIGSYCGTNTTANALVPGVVVTGTASLVQIGQIQFEDSGPNGVRGDTDDQVVGVQGIYIP